MTDPFWEELAADIERWQDYDPAVREREPMVVVTHRFAWGGGCWHLRGLTGSGRKKFRWSGFPGPALYPPGPVGPARRRRRG